MKRLSSITSSLAISTGVAGILNAIIVILKDESHGFKKLLASVTGHHWVSHGLLLLLLWLIVAFILAFKNVRIGPEKAWRWIFWGNFVGVIILVIFYLMIL